MREYLPLLILGAIIGTFTVVFLLAYALEKNKKSPWALNATWLTVRSSAA